MAISKYSRQRELIYKTVIENKVHPTAEFVYNYLKKITHSLVWEQYIEIYSSYLIMVR